MLYCPEKWNDYTNYLEFFSGDLTYFIYVFTYSFTHVVIYFIIYISMDSWIFTLYFGLCSNITLFILQFQLLQSRLLRALLCGSSVLLYTPIILFSELQTYLHIPCLCLTVNHFSKKPCLVPSIGTRY